MDRSHMVRREHTCGRSHRFTAVSWEIVDVPAHPELREAPGELVETRCPVCGEVVGVDRPFLLLDPLPGVPLVSVDGWAPSGKAGREKVAAVVELPPPPPGFLIEADRTMVPLLLGGDDLEVLFATLASRGPERLERLLRALVTARRYLAVFMAGLEEIGSAEAAVEFQQAHRESLAEPGFQDYIDELLADMGQAGVAEAAMLHDSQLLRRLAQGGDPATAWHQHQEDREHFLRTTLAPEFARIMDGLSGSVVDPAARMALYKDGLTLAEVTGNRRMEAGLRADRAGERLQSFSIYHAEAFAAAEADLRQALELIGPEDPALTARCAMNLGMVLVRKSKGDRRENVEEARTLLHLALEHFTEDGDPDNWAMTVTNLSLVYEARETGDRRENLRIADELCRSAYRVRTRERNAVDWAYTTANLAFILIEASKISSADDTIEEALRLCDEAAAVFADAGEPRIAADVLHNSAVAGKVYVEQSSRRRMLAAAREIARRPEVDAFLATLSPAGTPVDEWVVDLARLLGLNPRLFGFPACPAWAEELTEVSTPDATERAYLSTALAQADRARTLREPAGGVAYAVSCRECARLHQLAGTAGEQRRELLEQALAALEVHDGPQLVLEVAALLGEMHATAGRWADAARVYARAVAALDWRYAERLTGDKRIEELRSVTKLVEWAAYAHATAGDPEGAVRLLEDGRARGLADDLALDSAAVARLRENVPSLAAQFDDVRRRLADAITAEQRAAAAARDGIADRMVTDRLIACRREYAALLLRIRKVTGFDDFLVRTSDAEIAAMSHADAPLIYLVATAAGAVSLIVAPADRDGVGELSVTAVPSEVTSAELVRCLGYYRADGPLGLLSGGDGGVAAVLPEAQDLLGRAFGRAIRRELARRGATRACVVATGILSALPISSALCDEADPAATLADHVALTIAPSARVQSICERRRDSRQHETPRLVGVGNPRGDLLWSAVEVDEVARLFPDGAIVRTGQAATSDFVLGTAADATHLHLACHGYSSIIDPVSSGIDLADGLLTVGDLLATTSALRCRLAVLSACESGRIDVASTPNEFRGLPQAFITLGSAAVIASLWRVDDLPTAMLLITFYEKLRALGGDDTGQVAVALQQAQLWLRSVTWRDVELFVAKQGMRPVASGERGTLLRRVRDWFLGTNGADENDLPFRDARYWAAFVMIGA